MIPIYNCAHAIPIYKCVCTQSLCKIVYVMDIIFNCFAIYENMIV